MELTRAQWKNLLREINKGGLQKFKEFISQVEDEAYNSALQFAMANVKTAILDSVEKTLHAEFGFGQKRIDKFTDAFTKQLQEATIKEENAIIEAEPEKASKFVAITDDDRTAFMIFLCMKHFVQTLYEKESPLFSDKDVKYHLGNAVAMLDYVEQSAAPLIKGEELKALYEDVVKRKLYLTGGDN